MHLPHGRLHSFFKRLLHTSGKCLSTSTDEVVQRKCKTGILMLNAGGPISAKEIESYMIHLSLDKSIISYPLQKYIGPFLAKQRALKLANYCKTEDNKYSDHGWAAIQGKQLIDYLDILSPETAPHLPFLAFQHSRPSIEEALEELEMYDVERAVALPMFPHYSCSTTGGSLNRILKHYKERRDPSKVLWSTVDRWPLHPAFINSFVESIKEGLEKFPKDILENIVIIFSAQSIPMQKVYRGDVYHHEIAASVYRIMEKLGNTHPFIISWQSKVCPLPCLGPETKAVVRSLEASRHEGALIVPISLTSDDAMADAEYSEILSKQTKLSLHRAECPNARPAFIKGLAELVSKHLESGPSCSNNFAEKCTHCPDRICSRTKEYFQECQNIINVTREKSALEG